MGEAEEREGGGVKVRKGRVLDYKKYHFFDIVIYK